MPIEILFPFLTTGASAFILAVVLALRPRMVPKWKVLHNLLAVGAAWLMLNAAVSFFAAQGIAMAPTVEFSAKTWDPLLLRCVLLAAALVAFFGGGSGTPPSSPVSSASSP